MLRQTLRSTFPLYMFWWLLISVNPKKINSVWTCLTYMTTAPHKLIESHKHEKPPKRSFSEESYTKKIIRRKIIIMFFFFGLVWVGGHHSSPHHHPTAIAKKIWMSRICILIGLLPISVRFNLNMPKQQFMLVWIVILVTCVNVVFKWMWKWCGHQS